MAAHHSYQQHISKNVSPTKPSAVAWSTLQVGLNFEFFTLHLLFFHRLIRNYIPRKKWKQVHKKECSQSGVRIHVMIHVLDHTINTKIDLITKGTINSRQHHFAPTFDTGHHPQRQVCFAIYCVQYLRSKTPMQTDPDLSSPPQHQRSVT